MYSGPLIEHWAMGLFSHTRVPGFYIAICQQKNTTAGLLISCTLGRCHNFCCRGPILIPRPVLEIPAQTTRGNVLDFFVKPKNGITVSFTKRR